MKEVREQPHRCLEGKYYREGKVKVSEVRACLGPSRKGKEGNTAGMHEGENSWRGGQRGSRKPDLVCS